MFDGANSRPLRPSSSDCTPFMKASLKVRPIAITSPPTSLRRQRAVRLGELSKFQRES